LDSIQKILDGLTKACVNSRPSYFKPFLLSNKVTSDWPNKESFYEFFKLMISNSRKISQGKIHLIIKSIGENKSYYNFHDSINVHPVLNIVIIEQNDSLHIDILPF
jgi:hypothetical protein